MAGMNRVAEAAQRLEKAVKRLEAVARRVGGVNQRKDLETALANARAQYAALSQVTATVASRLDQTIGRLDRVLEG